MLKKRIIILFLTLFLFKTYSNTGSSLSNNSILDSYYTSSPDQFFTKGIIAIDGKNTSFELYSEKNSEGFNNFSININENLYKTISKEYKDLFELNSIKIHGDSVFYNTLLPLELLNYPIRNKEYTILEKYSSFKYKNLRSNKILIKDKIEIIPVPVIDQNGLPIDIIRISKNNYLPDKYEKIIYIISNESNIILRKEFYLRNNDRAPKYIIEVNSIKYIGGYYIATDWTIKEPSSSNMINFKYNVETIIYNKKDVSNKFSQMISFYGVR